MVYTMQKKLILIIEDEADIRQDLSLTLKLNDYDVIAGEDGKEGVLLAKKHSPDLIISDIMMPEKDGYEVLEELQQSPETSTIPFLFLTAKTSKDDHRHSMKLGADDFISKPYDIDDLLASVKTRLKKTKQVESKAEIKFNTLRKSLSRSIPHELRTPLNLIMGLSEFLERNFEKTPEAEIKEMINNIYVESKRLNRFVENYIYFANLEIAASSKDEIANIRNQTTPLAEIVIKDIVYFKAGNSGRSLDVNFKLEDAEIKISYDHFAKVINEVTDNCFKFSERGTPVNIFSKKVNGHFEFEFEDFGRGMTKQEIDNIGAYMQFGRKIYEQQGNGLGIAITRRIIELHNGEFSIHSEPDNFTKVRMKLPCA